MRVCIEKSTGKLIESQSGGTTEQHLQTLVNNAMVGGYSEDDVEVFYEDDADFAVRLATKIEAEKTYVDRRKAAYPNPVELNDALVKQQHSNSDVVAKGQAQEMQYYSDCLKVKADIPKE